MMSLTSTQKSRIYMLFSQSYSLPPRHLLRRTPQSSSSKQHLQSTLRQTLCRHMTMILRHQDQKGRMDDFQGNKVYVGTSPISVINTMLFIYTFSHRQQGQRGDFSQARVPQCRRPRWLEVPGGWPATAPRRRTRNAKGGPAMAVVKDGRTTAPPLAG